MGLVCRRQGQVWSRETWTLPPTATRPVPVIKIVTTPTTPVKQTIPIPLSQFILHPQRLYDASGKGPPQKILPAQFSKLQDDKSNHFPPVLELFMSEPDHRVPPRRRSPRPRRLGPMDPRPLWPPVEEDFPMTPPRDSTPRRSRRGGGIRLRREWVNYRDPPIGTSAPGKNPDHSPNWVRPREFFLATPP